MNAPNFFGAELGYSATTLSFAALGIWSLFWKLLATWHAAKRKERVWFILLFLVNTFGLFEIMYLFVVAKIKPNALLK